MDTTNQQLQQQVNEMKAKLEEMEALLDQSASTTGNLKRMTGISIHIQLIRFIQLLTILKKI